MDRTADTIRFLKILRSAMAAAALWDAHFDRPINWFTFKALPNESVVAIAIFSFFIIYLARRERGAHRTTQMGRQTQIGRQTWIRGSDKNSLCRNYKSCLEKKTFETISRRIFCLTSTCILSLICCVIYSLYSRCEKSFASNFEKKIHWSNTREWNGVWVGTIDKSSM